MKKSLLGLSTISVLGISCGDEQSVISQNNRPVEDSTRWGLDEILDYNRDEIDSLLKVREEEGLLAGYRRNIQISEDGNRGMQLSIQFDQIYNTEDSLCGFKSMEVEIDSVNNLIERVSYRNFQINDNYTYLSDSFLEVNSKKYYYETISEEITIDYPYISLAGENGALVPDTFNIRLKAVLSDTEDLCLFESPSGELSKDYEMTQTITLVR